MGSFFGLQKGALSVATCCGAWPLSRKPLAAHSKRRSDRGSSGSPPRTRAVEIPTSRSEFNRANPLASSSALSRRHLQMHDPAASRPSADGSAQSASNTRSSSGNAGSNNSGSNQSGSNTRSGSDDGAPRTEQPQRSRGAGPGETYVRSNPLNAAIDGALRRASEDLGASPVGLGAARRRASEDIAGLSPSRVQRRPSEDVLSLRAREAAVPDTVQRHPTFLELQRSWFAHPSDAEPSSGTGRGNSRTPKPDRVSPEARGAQRSQSSALAAPRSASVAESAAPSAASLKSATRTSNSDPVRSQPTFQELQRSWFAHPSEAEPSSERAGLALAVISPRGSAAPRGSASPDSAVDAGRGASIDRSQFSPRKTGRTAPSGSPDVTAGAGTASRSAQIRGSGHAAAKTDTVADFRMLQRSWFAHPDDAEDDGAARGAVQTSAAPSVHPDGSKSHDPPLSVHAPLAASTAVGSSPALSSAGLTGASAAGRLGIVMPAPVPVTVSVTPEAGEPDPTPASLTFRQRQALLRAHLEQE